MKNYEIYVYARATVFVEEAEDGVAAIDHALARPHDSGDLDRYLAEFDKQTRCAYADDTTVQG